MATVNVANKAELMTAIKTGTSSGDVIKLAAGAVFDVAFWPANTTKTLTLAPQDVNNPPELRGFNLGTTDTEGSFVKIAGEERATSMSNITFDGLKFKPIQYTACKNTSGAAKPIQDLPADGQGGYGWRVDLSYPNNTDLNGKAGMKGLPLGSGASHITVRNCLFEHFSNCFQSSGASFLTVEFNTFRYNCEDMIKNYGTDDFLYQYNECTNFRGLSLRDAQLWDYDDTVPPHADFFQFACTGTSQVCHRGKLHKNYLEDTTTRVHCLLFSNRYAEDDYTVVSRKHQDIEITSNQSRQSHATGLIASNHNNLTYRGNKISRLSGSASIYLMYGTQGKPPYTNDALTGAIDISNNVAPSFLPSIGAPAGSGFTMQGNQKLNNETTMPDNWVEIRRDKALPGNPMVGMYGLTGGVPPVTGGPAALADVDFNMIGTMEDPNHPGTSLTGVIEIPVGSAAYDADSIWWGATAETPMPTVFLGTTTGNSRLFRCNSATTQHLKAPGVAYSGIYVYQMRAGVLSPISLATCRFTTPAAGDRTLVQVKPRA